ncbi:MAG: amino acid adenylation domain-containing protein [Candidatus Sulfotelmatobacter sp.]
MPGVIDLYPLSPIQQGILFHSLFSKESGVYMVQTHCVLHPSPDVSAFEQAWNEVVRRHAIFRTAFEWEGLDDAMQVVYDDATISLTQLDWRAQSVAEQNERLREYLAADRLRGFDFSAPPLMRLALIKLDDTSSQFVWTVHHLLTDTWSEMLLFGEASALYEAFCEKSIVNTDPAPSYRDYIKWIQTQDLSEADAFWRRQLQGFQSPTPLGIRQTPSLRSAAEQAYESQQITLSTEMTSALQSLARQHEVTLNTLTQGAWTVLLSHYSGENDIVFGLTVSGRPFSLPGAEFIIGPFLNTLPMRVQLGSDVTLSAWLRDLQALSADLLQFEYSPLLRVQGLSNVQSGSQLFESIYVYQSAPVNLLHRGKESTNHRLEIRDLQTVQNSNYPLCVLVTPARQLLLQITYDSSAFSQLAIGRMLEHLRNLLEGIIAQPTSYLYELPLLSEGERREQLVEWNQTEAEFPRHGSLSELFERQAEKTPEASALRFEGMEFTYRQLNSRANQLAHYLREQGVGPEVRVGVLMERSVEMVVSLLGVVKAGGAYVPLDPQYPSERLLTMVGDAEPRVILTQPGRAERLGSKTIKTFCVEEERELLDRYSHENLASVVEPENAVYMIYTSGSTGKPKGVINTQAGICNRLLWMQQIQQVNREDRVLQKTPFSFDVSVWEFFAPLITGGCLVVAKPGGHQDAEYLIGLIATEQITTVHFVPSMLTVFLEAEGVERCTSLKRVICSGEALPYETQKRFFERLGHAELHNLYGPTEAAIDVTYWKCEAHSARHVVPIGRPIANTKVYVLDKRMEPVPVGVNGELYLSGRGLARGYWRQPGMTAEKFVPDPYSKSGGERLYRTGDSVRYLGDGALEFRGRLDSQVKLRGYRIELGEIEAALRGQEQVREAVVELRQGENGTSRLVGYVVMNGEERDETRVKELRNYLREQLPEYMVPSAFVLLPELPLTPNGKLDRRALMNSELQQEGQAEGPIAPRSQTEIILSGIWAEVLRCEKAGVNANFFDLGGHSLLAMRLVSKIRESFKVDLPLRTIFEAATLAEMARAVDTALRQNATLEMSPIQRRSRERQAPLSFAQQRLWLIQQLNPESTAYNVSSAVRLRGSLNVGALEKALNEIVRRHEILRTTFTVSSNQLAQIVAPAVPLNLDLEDLRTSSVAEQEAEARRIATQEAQVVFNLQEGPLFRVRLLRLSNDHVLTICRHHIIFDAWSHEIFTNELVTLYDAFDKGQTSSLPELPIQYPDFACWERDWLQDEKLKTLLSYWRKQLDGAPAVLKLPADRPASTVSSYDSRWHSFILDKNQTKTIRALSQAERVTVYMFLVAAFKTFLYRYCGQSDFVIGTPVTSRNLAETELLIGCFLNMLVLRTDLSGNPTFRELLGRVRETVLGAYTHQEMPFERLVEELKVGRSQSSPPFVQVVFSHVKPLYAIPKISGLEVTPLNCEAETAKVDWLMLMVEQGEEIISSLQYRVDLFDDETITHAMSHFEKLFHSIVQNPDTRLDDFDLLSREEQMVLNREIDVSPLSRGFSF